MTTMIVRCIGVRSIGGVIVRRRVGGGGFGVLVSSSSDRVVLIVGPVDAPVDEVHYLAPEAEWDSGFMLVMDGAPWSAKDVRDEHRSVTHLGCLLDSRPELGAGLDAARTHGSVYLDGGDWRPLDMEG